MMCSSWMAHERANEREKKIIVGGFLLLQYKIYCRTTTANGIALNYFFYASSTQEFILSLYSHIIILNCLALKKESF